MLAGQVIVGAVVSRTVTVNVQVRVFCGVAWSLAVQVTVVVPNGKAEPEAWAQLTVGLGSHESIAVALKLTAAPAVLVHSAVTFAGHVIAGPVVSRTVTVNVHVLVFGGVA